MVELYTKALVQAGVVDAQYVKDLSERVLNVSQLLDIPWFFGLVQRLSIFSDLDQRMSFILRMFLIQGYFRELCLSLLRCFYTLGL